MNGNVEQLDCVVIGAGWYGLAAAKQFFVEHPGTRMAVLDSAPSVGGVWAEHRLYPGLKSNNLAGTYEYPDFPMDEARFGVKPGRHPSGQAIYAYHKAYAEHFGFSGLVRTNTRVLSAEHHPEGGWTLAVVSNFDVLKPDYSLPQSRIFARRLIVATGLTSEPFMPHFEGQEGFDAPLFHPRDFLQNAHTINPATTKRVTVLGGTKFAWDAVYAYASKGVKVDWVIRASGHGTCWMAPPYVTPFKMWLEKLVNTRFLTWFSPCVWAADSGYAGIRRFWHGTAVGRTVTNAFWRILGDDALNLCGFDSHPETAKLKPWTQAFYAGCSFSILNYETDFFELVRSGAVSVHVADIARLGPHEVHLADENKTVLRSDALLCVTGWKHIPPLKFLPEGIDRELGMPHMLAPGAPSPADLASQTALFDRADAEIFARFPRLRDPPAFNARYVPLAEQQGVSVAVKDGGDAITPASPTTSYLLYRFVVPAQAAFFDTRDTAFVGFSQNFSNAISAHLQGLWISAFFDGKLARDPADGPLADAQYETVLHNRIIRWRHPYDYGNIFPNFVFDAVPYMDMLLADLGLAVHRKKGWWAEVTQPYGVEDYRDVNAEWNRKWAAKKADAASL